MKKILIIIVILFVAFLVLRDVVIKQAIESVGSSVLGAPVKVGKFSLSLLTSRVRMDDFRIDNPVGFSNSPLIDIGHIEVRYDLGAILGGKYHCSLIDLDIRQLLIERNESKVYNVSSLKIKPQEDPKVEDSAPTQKQDKPLAMQIDVLKLNVGKVIFRDELPNGQVKESSMTTGLQNKTFKDIRSPQQLVALVLFESSGVGALKDIGMAATKQIVGDVKDVAVGVRSEAKKTVNSLLGSVKSIIK